MTATTEARCAGLLICVAVQVAAEDGPSHCKLEGPVAAQAVEAPHLNPALPQAMAGPGCALRQCKHIPDERLAIRSAKPVARYTK